MTTLIKQPTEIRLFNFEFAALLATGETITSVVSVTSTPAGLTLGTPASSGSQVQVQISDGTALTRYELTAIIDTSLSNRLEAEGALWVKDKNASEDAALAELIYLTDADGCPTLSYGTPDSELDLILANHQRASEWVATTVYEAGDRVIPTLRNGHHFICVTPGTTATTEPNWSTTRDARHTDGTVVWQEDGYDWNGWLYDIDGAAEEAWIVKAGKSVGRIDFNTAQGISMSASQLHDHCLTMAKRFHTSFLL